MAGADDGLLVLGLLDFIGVFLQEGSHLRFRVVIVPRIHKGRFRLLNTRRRCCRYSDAVEHTFQYFAIVIDVIFRLREFLELIDVGFEVGKVDVVLFA